MRYKFASALVIVLAISTCFGAAPHRFLWEAGEYRLTQAQVADRFESVGKAGVYFKSETDIHRWGGPFDLSKERFVAAGKAYVDSVAAAFGQEVSYFPEQVWLLPQARIACFFGAAGTLPAVVHNVVSLLDQLAGYIKPALSYSAHHRTAMVAFLKELLSGSPAGSGEDALRILVADYATYVLPG
ncbi:hypothetical protein EBZ39_13865, partial [bacterium]|nr:hypothetical protein [bacterium]